MKEYNINSMHDFDDFVSKVRNYVIKTGFKPFKIISKKQSKTKTSQQHAYYWFCINEVKEAFKKIEVFKNEADIIELLKDEKALIDSLHNEFKRKSGFTKVIHLKNGNSLVINKSLKNNIEDEASVTEAMHLIQFIKDWTLENLGYKIKDAEEFNL